MEFVSDSVTVPRQIGVSQGTLTSSHSPLVLSGMRVWPTHCVWDEGMFTWCGVVPKARCSRVIVWGKTSLGHSTDFCEQSRLRL